MSDPRRNISRELSYNPRVSEPGFVTEDKEDIIRIREVPMQADFEAGADEIITIRERAPEESEADPEEGATELYKVVDNEEKTTILDPQALRREAEEGPLS